MVFPQIEKIVSNGHKLPSLDRTWMLVPKDTDLGCGLRRLMQIDLQCNFVSVRERAFLEGFWDSGAGGLWFYRCVFTGS